VYQVGINKGIGMVVSYIL